MADVYEQPLCAMCDKASTQLCGGCKSVKYCSKACQKLDWSTHKLICKTWKDFLASRPDEEHFSMIYFPVDQPQPRFIWMPLCSGHNHPSIEGLAERKVDIAREPSEDHPKGGIVMKDVLVNAALDRPLGPHFILFAPPTAAQCCPCCVDKFQPNESLRQIDAELAETLRGPILAWGLHLEDHLAKISHGVNLGPMDFRHMVDELRSHYEEAVESFHLLTSERPGAKAVKVVRLNCKGDQETFQKPHLQPWLMPKSVLQEQPLLPTPLADRLAMPLLVFKVAPAPLWRDRQLKSRMHNCCSGYLNPFTAMPDDIGSLIVARKDGKELKPELLEAFFQYVASKLETDGTKPPYPAGRINEFTLEHTVGWMKMMAFMDKFETTTVRAADGEDATPTEEQDESMEDF